MIHEHWYTSEMSQKAAPVKATCLLLVEVQWYLVSLLIKLLIGSENCALLLFVHVVTLFTNQVTYIFI